MDNTIQAIPPMSYLTCDYMDGGRTETPELLHRAEQARGRGASSRFLATQERGGGRRGYPSRVHCRSLSVFAGGV
jgi:hypothetical protein